MSILPHILQSRSRLAAILKKTALRHNNSHFAAKGQQGYVVFQLAVAAVIDRKSTRLNSSHGYISYAVFCLKKKKKYMQTYSAIAPRTLTRYALHQSSECRHAYSSACS